MKKRYMKTALLSITILTFGFIACQVLVAEEEGSPRKRRPEGKEMRGERSGGGRGGPEQWIEKMKEKDPEEFERLMQLRASDPETFRKEIHEMVKSKMKDGGKSGHGGEKKGRHCPDPEIMKLAEQYRAAETEEEKASIKAELTQHVSEGFEKSNEEQQKQLQDMEKRLEDMRKCLKKRQDSKDDIIKYRLEHFLRDPSLR